MDLHDAILTRRSIRGFTSDPVSSEVATKILEAAIRAPSAGNCQPWEFIVVRDAAAKQALATAAFGQDFIAEAPLVIVVCANRARSRGRYGDRGTELYCIQDTAAATQNILLTAHSLGLGACWIGAFDERMVAEQMGTPSEVRPVAIIPIGKAVTNLATGKANRMPLKDVVHYDSFNS